MLFERVSGGVVAQLGSEMVACSSFGFPAERRDAALLLFNLLVPRDVPVDVMSTAR